MSFRRVNLLALVAGVVCGLLFFLLVYVFRESYVAAAQLDSDSPGTSRGWRGAFSFFGGAGVGLGAAALSDRVCAASYRRLLLPLGVLVSAMTGTAVLLELEYLRPIFTIVLTPTILFGAIAVVTAVVYGWTRS